jgi:hypothetical protein
MFAEHQSRLTVSITAGLIAAFAAVNYATPRVAGPTNDQWILGPLLGICIAQVTLIAAWAVFAPGNIVVRLPWSLLLGLMMWYVLAISDQLRYVNASGIAQLGVSLLLGVSVLQVPLWIAKRAFRYRMLSPGEVVVPTSQEKVQFELKHMLIGTFLFALGLAPLRVVLPAEAKVHIHWDRELPVLLGAAIIVNLIATLPCLWGGFVSNAKALVLGICWLLYCLAITGLEFGCLCAVLGRPGPNPLEVFFVFCLMNASQGAVVFAVMRIYRALGYRMLRAPRTLPTPAPEPPAVEIQPLEDAAGSQHVSQIEKSSD